MTNTPLDLKTEINLGSWTNISTKVYQRDPVTVNRGRADESSTASPSNANLTLNNTTGDFSPRNPLGAYYGTLGRNTPLRLSLPAQSNYLRLEGDTTSYVTTPDSAGLSVTGDIELQVDMFITGYSSEMMLASKFNDNGVNQRSWILAVVEGGIVAFDWSANGSAISGVHSTKPLPVGRVAVKVTLDVNNGASGNTVTFWTAPTISGSWTQLGAAVVTAGTTSVFDSTAPVVVGYDANFSNLTPSINGNVYGFKVLSGIGGTVKGYADFTAATAGASTYTDAQSNVWTLNGTAEISNRLYRFHGEVSAWPPKWDYAASDVYTQIQASGVTRRISQGSPAADSVLKRYNRTLSGGAAPFAYWACEDGSSSTQIGATIGNAMSVTGSPTLAADSSFFCSSAIPTLNGSTWQVDMPRTSVTPTVNNLKFLLSIPSGGDTNNSVIARYYTTGTIVQLDLAYGTGSSGSFTLTGLKNDGSQAFSLVLAAGINGKNLLVSMMLTKNSTSVDYAIDWLDQAVPGFSDGSGGTVSSASVGKITRAVINPGGLLTGCGVGHIMAGSVNDLSTYIDPFDAYAGETASARLTRICVEEGLASRIYGYPDNTQAMGAQTPMTVTDIIQQVEDTDRGMLYEPRQVLGIGYRTRESIENQAATVTLSYSAGDLGTDSTTAIEPTDDDQFTRNDVTITRANGSSGRQTLTSGTLSVAAPPNGVGTYDYSTTLSLYEDSQAINLAGWILHVGTIDEPRYPVIPVNLLTANPQYYTIQAVDQGDFLDVTIPVTVTWLPPGDIKQIIAGTREQFGGFDFTIQFNCVPEKPYETGVVGSGAATDNRVDTDGSTLHAGCTSAATSVTVDTTVLTTQALFLWTTAAADFPFDIMVGGEQMTVTNITGSSSPQTFTVTRSVNGVVKAHSSGEAVNVLDYTIIALGDPF